MIELPLLNGGVRRASDRVRWNLRRTRCWRASHWMGAHDVELPGTGAGYDGGLDAMPNRARVSSAPRSADRVRRRFDVDVPGDGSQGWGDFARGAARPTRPGQDLTRSFATDQALRTLSTQAWIKEWLELSPARWRLYHPRGLSLWGPGLRRLETFCPRGRLPMTSDRRRSSELRPFTGCRNLPVNQQDVTDVKFVRCSVKARCLQGGCRAVCREQKIGG